MLYCEWRIKNLAYYKIPSHRDISHIYIYVYGYNLRQTHNAQYKHVVAVFSVYSFPAFFVIVIVIVM